MSLQKFCARPVITITPEQNIADACQLLQDKNVGCVVVVEGGKLCGVLTDRDIALKVVGAHKDPYQTTVREIMTPHPVRISVDQSLHELTALMHRHHVRRVPIVDGENKVQGIVTLDDLLVLLGEEMSDISKSLTAALFRAPAAATPEEAAPPFEWLMSYL